MKRAILCHGFTEPYCVFCGCISSHMNSLEIQSQKVCVCVCVCQGGGTTQCTLKMSSVKLHKFVVKVGKYIRFEFNFLFCFQKPKISISLLEGLCVQVRL